jgi:ubiquitin-protein ligase
MVGLYEQKSGPNYPPIVKKRMLHLFSWEISMVHGLKSVYRGQPTALFLDSHSDYPRKPDIQRTGL